MLEKQRKERQEENKKQLVELKMKMKNK